MNSKKALGGILGALAILLVSIAAGTVLMIGVYMLPTGQMLTNVDESYEIIDTEGGSFTWAPGYPGSRLDGFTDNIMLQTAVLEGSGNPIRDAMLNGRMDFPKARALPGRRPHQLRLWSPERGDHHLWPVLARLSAVFKAPAAVFQSVRCPHDADDGPIWPGGGTPMPGLQEAGSQAGGSSGAGFGVPEPGIHRHEHAVYQHLSADLSLLSGGASDRQLL